MPNVATLKNAYRDRPPKKRPGRESDDGESLDGGQVGNEKKKVPQSFTFLRREGGGLNFYFLHLVTFTSLVPIEKLFLRPSHGSHV